jgi:nicotinate-nucleotide adenylyltransferase
MQKIGIYSGAFDPVHDGHVAFAKEAIVKTGLDRVYFLVEPRPRHKQGVKALEHRIAMVQFAIAAEEKLGLLVLDQQRFTVHETWPVIRERFRGADVSMLMGEDVFSRLSHWPRIDELITTVRFIVGIRNSHNELRDHLEVVAETKALQLHYETFRTDKSLHASSHIRGVLRRGGMPEGIHPSVLEYIRQNGLYFSSE